MRTRCECGRQTASGSAMCSRCAVLDGDAFSPSAAAILAQMRILISATWEVLFAALPQYSTRQVQRAVSELLAAGRLSRVEIDTPSSGYGGQSIAEFHLVSEVRDDDVRRAIDRGARRRAYLARQKRSRHERGLCISCPRKVKDGGWSCARCRRRTSEGKAQRSVERRVAGLCRCGRDPRAGFATCEPCAGTARRVAAERRDKKLAAGLCTYSTCERPLAGKRHCEEHTREHSKRCTRWFRRQTALRRAEIARAA